MVKKLENEVDKELDLDNPEGDNVDAPYGMDDTDEPKNAKSVDMPAKALDARKASGPSKNANIDENKPSIKESVESLFDGNELSEDFKTKAEAIFESALAIRLEEETARLEEQYNENLQEESIRVIEEMTENVDSYMDYVAKQWFDQNKVGIESNIKVGIAESLISGIKNLLAEHNISVTDEQVSEIESLQKQVDESADRYNGVVNELIESKNRIEELERDIAFRNITEGLTTVQVEKIRDLSESLSFGSTSEFKTKVQTLRDNYFTESATTDRADETEFLEEEVVSEKPKADKSSAMANYLNAVSRKR